MPRTSNKREKLLDAASALIHKQGFKHTTLADIAEKSEVPLGNVYYYFKTKDDIASAVMQERNAGLAEMAEQWEKTCSDPRQRLLAFLDHIESTRDSIAENGCPIGSLCQELNKETGPLAKVASETLDFLIQWAESQFKRMGLADSHAMAIEFVSNMQGIALLGNSLRDPALVSEQVERVRQKILAL